jgi:hypothetical protein
VGHAQRYDRVLTRVDRRDFQAGRSRLRSA